MATRLHAVKSAILRSPKFQTISRLAIAPNITTTPPEKTRYTIRTVVFEVINRIFASP